MHIPRSLIETSPVVADASEIFAILSSAQQSHASVAGRFVDGAEFLGGVIADVTDAGFVLDVGANDAAIRQLVAGSPVDLSLTVGRDRFAFRPVHRRLLRLYGRPAALYALPPKLSHIERRLHQRVELAADIEATAAFPIPTPLDEPTSLFSLCDISQGGIGILLPPVGPVPLLTHEYPGVTVAAGSGTVSALTVAVRNQAPTLIAGMRYIQAGCIVVDPPDRYRALVADLLARRSN